MLSGALAFWNNDLKKQKTAQVPNRSAQPLGQQQNRAVLGLQEPPQPHSPGATGRNTARPARTRTKPSW